MGCGSPESEGQLRGLRGGEGNEVVYLEDGSLTIITQLCWMSVLIRGSKCKRIEVELDDPPAQNRL